VNKDLLKITIFKLQRCGSVAYYTLETTEMPLTECRDQNPQEV